MKRMFTVLAMALFLVGMVCVHNMQATEGIPMDAAPAAGAPADQSVVQGGGWMPLPQPPAPSGQGAAPGAPGQTLPQFPTGQWTPQGTQQSQPMTMGGCPMMGGMGGMGGMSGMGGMGMMGSNMSMGQSGMTHNMDQGLTMREVLYILSMQDALQIMTDLTAVHEKMLEGKGPADREALRAEMKKVRERLNKVISDYRSMITGQIRQ